MELVEIDYIIRCPDVPMIVAIEASFAVLQTKTALPPLKGRKEGRS